MHYLIQPLAFGLPALYCSYAYLYLIYEGVFQPLQLYVVTVAASFAVGFVTIQTVLRRIPVSFAIWLWVFLCYTCALFLYSTQDDASIAVLSEHFETVALTAAFLAVFLQPNAVRTGQLSLVVVALWGVVLNCIDFVEPTWSTVAGRGAGLYSNPNKSGQLLVLTMLASLPVVPRNWRLWYCFYIGVGVLVTFSRGGWLLWSFAFISLAGVGYMGFRRRTTNVAAVVCVAVLGAITVISAHSMQDVFVQFGLAEYLTPETAGRLDISSAESQVSTESRLAVAANAWEVFAANPWLGCGLGCTRGWAQDAHDLYLVFAAEGGWVGLAVLVSLLSVVWRMSDTIGRVFAMTVALSFLFTHDFAAQPALMLLFALMVAAARIGSPCGGLYQSPPEARTGELLYGGRERSRGLTSLQEPN